MKIRVGAFSQRRPDSYTSGRQNRPSISIDFVLSRTIETGGTIGLDWSKSLY